MQKNKKNYKVAHRVSCGACYHAHVRMHGPATGPKMHGINQTGYRVLTYPTKINLSLAMHEDVDW